MGRSNLGKRLARLERIFPPPPPKAADLPVEEWVDEVMGFGGPALYGVEEDFFGWLEWLPGFLRSQMNLRLAEAWGPLPHGTGSALPPEIAERVEEALPPHIERWRRVFAEARPEREAKRLMSEEHDRLYGRYGVCREWVRDADREREALRIKYEGWEQQWEHDYEQWERRHQPDEQEDRLPDSPP